MVVIVPRHATRWPPALWPKTPILSGLMLYLAALARIQRIASLQSWDLGGPKVLPGQAIGDCDYEVTALGQIEPHALGSPTPPTPMHAEHHRHRPWGHLGSGDVHQQRLVIPHASDLHIPGDLDATGTVLEDRRRRSGRCRGGRSRHPQPREGGWSGMGRGKHQGQAGEEVKTFHGWDDTPASFRSNIMKRVSPRYIHDGKRRKVFPRPPRERLGMPALLAQAASLFVRIMQALGCHPVRHDALLRQYFYGTQSANGTSDPFIQHQ